MTGKDVLSEKDLLQKAAAIKRFEYLPSGSELNKQVSVVEKQYQGLNKLFKSDEKEEPVTNKKEKPTITGNSKLMYDSKYSFTDYYKIFKKHCDVSFTTRYDRLLSFYHRLNKFRNLLLRTGKPKIKK